MGNLRSFRRRTALGHAARTYRRWLRTRYQSENPTMKLVKIKWRVPSWRMVADLLRVGKGKLLLKCLLRDDAQPMSTLFDAHKRLSNAR